MERGPFPPDRPDPERPQGPESPQGPGPQAPPPGPLAPSPGPQAPPPPPQGPPGYAPPAPERAPGYGGPVPPGGWQQPIARPEAGWVGQPLASWGSRVAATVIDWLVLLIPAVILVALIVGGLDGDSSWGAVVGASLLSLLIWSAILLLYAPLLMIRQGERNGQTLGKQFVGIRVVRDTGEPFGFWWAVVREVVVKNILVSAVSIFIPVLPWLLDSLWPLWDGENRAVHDMIVTTHVIKV
jgi:uncharacterized RDD family membrane protein YckC